MKRVLLAGVLSALGFSCTECVQRDMYGCPYADFEVKGRVTGAENAPLKGIKVSVRTEKGESRLCGFRRERKVWSRHGDYLCYGRQCVGQGGGYRRGGWRRKFCRRLGRGGRRASDYKGGGEWYEGKATKNVDFILEKDK